jgi:ketosteroid isomerase-like protein
LPKHVSGCPPGHRPLRAAQVRATLDVVDKAELVGEMWQAWSSANFDAIEAAFAPDARWRAVEDGPWNCENRGQILNVIRQNHERRGAPIGKVEEIVDVGARIVVAFRPAHPIPDGWPLEDGLRYVVLTIKDMLVTEMKGCASRQVAFDYASS